MLPFPDADVHAITSGDRLAVDPNEREDVLS
jgi:hypothetical protein